MEAKVYNLCLELVNFVDSLPETRSSWILADQILAAGAGLGNCVFEASSVSEGAGQLCENALGKAKKLKFWLGLLADSGKGDINKVTRMAGEVTEIIELLEARRRN